MSLALGAAAWLLLTTWLALVAGPWWIDRPGTLPRIGPVAAVRTRPAAVTIAMMLLGTLAVTGMWLARDMGIISMARTGIMTSLLMAIAITDARSMIIPDELTIGGTVIILLVSVMDPTRGFWISALNGAAWAVMALSLAWLMERFIDEPALGGGDIKLMALLGASMAPVAVYGTVMVACVTALPYAWHNGVHKPIPFGVFLALGGLVVGSILG